MQAETPYCSATKSGLASVLMRLSAGWSATKGRLKQAGVLRFLLREPLFAFVLAGGLIFLAYFLIESRCNDPVAYTPDVAASLVGEFEELTGRKATAADRARIRDDFVGDELMFREAIARGMHLTDPETRERMIDRMRYMVAGVPVEPTEADLIDYYASHPDLYTKEAGTSFEHVFFASLPQQAPALLASLHAGESVPGEDFWLGRSFPHYGDSMIRGMFGKAFLAQLKSSPTGQWYGPARSNRGWHFVRKTGASARSKIPYSQARAQVRQDFLISSTRAALDKEIETLKGKYDVEITG